MGARLVPGRSHWVDETTLEVRLRKGLRYQDGEEFSAESFRRAFEEVQRVMLEANRDHWNTERGPRLERVPQRPVTGRGPGAGLHRSGGGRHRLRGLPRRRPDPARRGGLRRPRPPARRADPHYAAGVPLGQRPYGHDPDQACDLLASAGWPSGRELRLAAPAALEAAARRLSEDFTASLASRST